MTKAPAPTAPPFCPNPACPFHLRDRQRWRFEKIGFFERQSPPYQVQRYRCLSCRRSFSDQTFRATYWMRRADLLPAVLGRLQSCSGFRQMARELHVAPTSVAGVVARLGRHCLLFHEQMRPKGPIREELSADGFESLEWSQYYPSNYHVAVGKDSHYFYGFTATELRRKGRMTDAQRKTRAKLEAKLGRPQRVAPQARDDRLLQTPAERLRTDGDPRRVAQLDEAVLRARPQGGQRVAGDAPGDHGSAVDGRGCVGEAALPQSHPTP